MKSKAFDTSHKSLMYNKNNNGPKIDPWGTPYLMYLEEELKSSLYYKNWVPPDR